MVSLRDIGLSNPVRVQRRANGDGYNLIQGYRRYEAYRLLLAETGSRQWRSIPSLILPWQNGLKHLYRQMIDENIVRKELSFAEMAEAARNFAADPTSDTQTVAEALPILFQSASYARRSYIGAFARLLEHIGPILKYPTALPLDLGLQLLRMIETSALSVVQIKAALSNWDNRSVRDELDVLQRMTQMPEVEDKMPEMMEQKALHSPHAAYDLTTFDIRLPTGQAMCTASIGRLEIRANRNFARISRGHIEQAVQSLLDDDI